MHRWLCTTAPLLIGSIAVGTIHAAPGSEACLRKQASPRSQGDASEAPPAFPVAHQAEAANRVRLCTGCHDGSVAHANVDLREDFGIGGIDAVRTPALTGAQP